jgi:hypothetical protein
VTSDIASWLRLSFLGQVSRGSNLVYRVFLVKINKKGKYVGITAAYHSICCSLLNRRLPARRTEVILAGFFAMPKKETRSALFMAVATLSLSGRVWKGFG